MFYSLTDIGQSLGDWMIKENAAEEEYFQIETGIVS